MAQGSNSFDQQDHLQVVDALRGYAILLVIFSHATPYVPELVWPAKRFFLLGTYGVQLFFIASALTLLMSWGRSRDALGVRSVKFFVRRFFRIAPLYFLAIPFYWIVKQQVAADFSLETLFATLFFYNAWSPYLIPTVPGWIAVPGGWSIGVEFCFYLIFPLLAGAVDSLRRAMVFLVIALAIMIAASHFGAALYPEIGSEARGTFLYFWPPNHLAIFALGFVLYHGVKSDEVRQRVERSAITANRASLAMALIVVALSFYGQHKFFDFSDAALPTHLLISLAFMAWALVLVVRSPGLAVNRLIVKLGQVSFSAYVLHFCMLELANWVMASLWPGAKVGVASIAFAGALVLIGVLLTYFMALICYRSIEQPFIALGKRLIAGWRFSQVAVAQGAGAKK